jgi:biopolymer transport protein ExbD
LIIQPTGIVDVKRGESQQVVQMTAREIEGLWRQEESQNPNIIAAVKTHPDAPYKYMVDVLDALKSANAVRVSLQILEN